MGHRLRPYRMTRRIHISEKSNERGKETIKRILEAQPVYWLSLHICRILFSEMFCRLELVVASAFGIKQYRRNTRIDLLRLSGTSGVVSRHISLYLAISTDFSR